MYYACLCAQSHMRLKVFFYFRKPLKSTRFEDDDDDKYRRHERDRVNILAHAVQYHVVVKVDVAMFLWITKNGGEHSHDYTSCYLQAPDTRGRPASRDRKARGDDRESSVCRDVDKDESKMRRADTEEDVKIKK